jgi:death on curing protein
VIWVSLAAILAVHDRMLTVHGGADGVRDMGALESALARPANLAAYGSPDAADLAASYAAGIAKAHAFVDGNKRAAWMAAVMFLDMNVPDVVFDEAEAAAIMLQVAAGEVDAESLAQWFRERMR